MSEGITENRAIGSIIHNLEFEGIFRKAQYSRSSDPR